MRAKTKKKGGEEDKARKGKKSAVSHKQASTQAAQLRAPYLSKKVKGQVLAVGKLQNFVFIFPLRGSNSCTLV